MNHGMYGTGAAGDIRENNYFAVKLPGVELLRPQSEIDIQVRPRVFSGRAAGTTSMFSGGRVIGKFLPLGAVSNANLCGFRGRVIYDSPFAMTSSYLVGAQGDIRIQGAGNIGPQMIAGLWGSITQAGAGSYDTLMGVRGEITNAAGTSTTMAALWAATPEINGGAVTTNYGLYIDDQYNTFENGSYPGSYHPTNHWNIYAAGISPSALMGSLYIGDTANTGSTLGLTINQGANDDEILALKSSDIAHGMTAWCETDTFGRAKKHSATAGGLRLEGFSEDEVGLLLMGAYVNDDTGRATTADAAVIINAAKKSGTDVTAPGANANLFAVRANGATQFLVDTEGDIHMNATSNINAWDEYNDAALLTGLRGSLAPEGSELRRQFAEWIEYARPILEKTGVVTYNEDGCHFLSMKGVNMLLIDTVRQLYAKVETLERKLLE